MTCQILFNIFFNTEQNPEKNLTSLLKLSFDLKNVAVVIVPRMSKAR
jgi:hypothetical protein